MKTQSIAGLFEQGLAYAYDCEKQLTKALPKMAEAASSDELRQAFRQHLEETERHSYRLEQIFTMLGKSSDRKENDVVEAMIEEGEQMIKNIDASPVRDAALIVAGNQVEHYEMAVYGSLRTFAQLLGLDRAVSLLEETLNEEKTADRKLTQIGETRVNQEALHRSAAVR